MSMVRPVKLIISTVRLVGWTNDARSDGGGRMKSERDIRRMLDA